jgi:hypothetical protein
MDEINARPSRVAGRPSGWPDLGAASGRRPVITIAIIIIIISAPAGGASGRPLARLVRLHATTRTFDITTEHEIEAIGNDRRTSRSRATSPPPAPLATLYLNSKTLTAAGPAGGRE